MPTAAVTSNGHVVVNIGEVVRSERGQKRIQLAQEIVRRSRELYESHQPSTTKSTDAPRTQTKAAD